MHVPRLTAGIAAALLLPMGACSDGESKADPPESTATHSPTPSKSPTDGPTLPPEAQGTDEAAAKAFVKFYFELISDAMVTGDTTAIPKYSGDGCKTCASVPQRIRNVYDKGGHFETEGWVLRRITPIKAQSAGDQIFVLAVQETERRVYNKSGRLVETIEPTLHAMRIVLQRPGQQWSVARLDLVVT